MKFVYGEFDPPSAKNGSDKSPTLNAEAVIEALNSFDVHEIRRAVIEYAEDVAGRIVE